MKDQIVIRNYVHHDDAIMNVGENGTKTAWDANFKVKFPYASGNNIKHCWKDRLLELLGIIMPPSVYIKDAKDADAKVGQGEVNVELALDNPITICAGGWNPTTTEFHFGKYHKASIKAAVEISRATPLHPLLVSTTQDCGVRRGNVNDKVGYKTGDKVEFVIQDLIDNKVITEERAKELMKSKVPSNFFKQNTSARGIYCYDYIINLSMLKYCDITDVELPEEEIERLTGLGYEFTTMDGKNICVVPTEIAVNTFEKAVIALFTWDYSSNNSTHMGHPDFLRCAFALNNPSYVPMSMQGEVEPDGKTASIWVMSDEDATKCGIETFTSRSLKKFVATDGVNFDIFAKENAMKKIIEIGTNVLRSY